MPAYTPALQGCFYMGREGGAAGSYSEPLHRGGHSARPYAREGLRPSAAPVPAKSLERKMEKLELYVPKLEDLWFYQKMTSDPATMSYNANWNVTYDGYHRDTGCVDYPDEVLPSWHKNWVGCEPERFYAYIRRCSDGAWIGDVNFHYNPEKDWWDMGVLLYAPYRGQGYGVPALKLLLEHAFCVCGISRIHNDFQVSRNEVSAWETHRRAGFRELRIEDGFLQMMITKEEYLRGRK